ncbi:SRPBCC family protein [Pseudoroseicyclus sp. CXY001]|uniref:SRPBCC family protein n=1 Tax=Pseudoroseicyclus sp. CXY001 TaxID=3242492 RepID=UPI00357139E4
MSDSITRDIFIDAPPARVWAAISDAGEYGRWFNCRLKGAFATGALVSGEITEPGHEGTPFWLQVEEMVAPERFSFRWPWAEAAPEGALEETTLVTFTLAPEGAGTRLTVTESGFDAVPEGERARRLKDNATGWEIQCARIKAHVEPHVA